MIASSPSMQFHSLLESRPLSIVEYQLRMVLFISRKRMNGSKASGVAGRSGKANFGRLGWNLSLADASWLQFINSSRTNKRSLNVAHGLVNYYINLPNLSDWFKANWSGHEWTLRRPDQSRSLQTYVTILGSSDQRASKCTFTAAASYLHIIFG